MYRRRYQVMADELTQAADEYLDRVLDVQEARKDFMERHGADACQNKMPEGIVTGLRFGGMPPEGWTLVDDGRGFSVPDTGTAKVSKLRARCARCRRCRCQWCFPG